QSEETADRVSLYLTLLAFGLPTGGNASCKNMWFTCSSTVSPLHCKEKQWECTKCELSPCHQKRSKQDGIVKVPEETDCSEHLQTRRHRPCQEAITITSRRLEIEEEERRDICSPAKEKILIW
ncbi:hypothetical protein Tsp_13260, partial [Trichinella spiralis]|uniref:hypothetical protein n=1 Tax=Trichinella spiralis TaxID=6334 RepID=UPI0001EFE418